MARFKDETGNQYGRLTVLRRAEGLKRLDASSWRCQCVCGASVVVLGSSLRSGNTTSCGCKHITGFPKDHQITRAYYGAKNRCENPNNPAYANYGGRGIEFRFKSMFKFWEELGPTWQPGLSIDRKDNEGHYEPGNCRWATAKEQGQNKRNVIRIKYKGQDRTLKECAEEVGVKYDTIKHRYAKHGADCPWLFSSVK